MGVASQQIGRFICTSESSSVSIQSTPFHSAGQAPEQGRARVVKKYPNRRLYDTTTSTYITLAEIKHLVMASEPVVVRDAKTGEDLTRSILLQIILEEEAVGAPMFSEAVLAHLIRFYGHAMQGYMGTFLEGQLQMFTDWQSRMGEQSHGLTAEKWGQFMQWQSPLLQNMLSSMLQPSSAVMGQMQEKLQQQMQKNTEQMLGVLGLKP
jgi:polyhydroxyalkanoate synthesis repressor PhaR